MIPFLLVLVLLAPEIVLAQALDKYGAVKDITCADAGSPSTVVSYPIASVARASKVTTITTTTTMDTTHTMHPNAAVIISGTSADDGSFNHAADTLSYVSSVPSATIFTFAQNGGNVGTTSDRGTVTLARWSTCKVGNRWYFRSPFGHPMWLQSIQASGVDNIVDRAMGYNVNDDTLLRSKYATGPDGTGSSHYYYNYQIAFAKTMLRWGFNTMGEYVDVNALAVTPNYSIGDRHTPVKLPFYRVSSFSLSATAAQGYYHVTPVKTYGTALKRSVAQIPTYFGGGGQISSIDPFDPNWSTAIAARYRNAFVTFKYLDYFMGVMTEDQDYAGHTRAGSDFCDVYHGAYLSQCGGKSGFHWGYMTLLQAPVMGAGVVPRDRTILTASILHANTTMHAKDELVKWLQAASTVDRQTGASATRRGSTVTYAKPGHQYIKNELVTLTECSDSTFNTVAGTGVKVTATTGSTFTVTLAGAGSSATGCKVTPGPGYASIRGLNLAWGSSYTQFASTGTQVTGESLGTGDGRTTRFSKTLAHVPSPMSVQVFAAGTLTCADDASGPTGVRFPATSGSFVGNCSGASSSVNYANGNITVVFSSAPASGHALTVNYVHGGWGTGAGLADEDGKSAHLASGDIYSLAGLTVSMKTDLDNFLFHWTKAYYRSVKRNLDIYFPGRLLFGGVNVGKICTPIRAPMLQAMAAYQHVLAQNGLNCPGLSDMQARIDFVATNFGDKPWIDWAGITANADSQYSRIPGNATVTPSGRSGAITLTASAPVFVAGGYLSGGDQGTSVLITSGVNAGARVNSLVIIDNQHARGTASTPFANASANAVGTWKIVIPDPDQWPWPPATTQAQRAAHWVTLMNGYLTQQSRVTGSYHWAGYGWWAWTGQRNEAANWALKTVRDNAYDGKEATTKAGTDWLGYPVGCPGDSVNVTTNGALMCEPADYGDFISTVVNQNARWLDYLTRAPHTRPGPPAGQDTRRIR